MIVLELTVTCRPVEMPPPLDPEFFEIVVEVTVHRQKQVCRRRRTLCHQDLDAEASQRMKDFEGYVKGKLETDARKAEEAFKKDSWRGFPPVR